MMVFLYSAKDLLLLLVFIFRYLLHRNYVHLKYAILPVAKVTDLSRNNLEFFTPVIVA